MKEVASSAESYGHRVRVNLMMTLLRAGLRTMASADVRRVIADSPRPGVCRAALERACGCGMALRVYRAAKVRVEAVRDVCGALSDYHIAAGGLGLIYRYRDGRIECIDPTAEPEGQDKDERHG